MAHFTVRVADLIVRMVSSSSSKLDWNAGQGEPTTTGEEEPLWCAPKVGETAGLGGRQFTLWCRQRGAFKVEATAGPSEAAARQAPVLGTCWCWWGGNVDAGGGWTGECGPGCGPARGASEVRLELAHLEALRRDGGGGGPAVCRRGWPARAAAAVDTVLAYSCSKG